MHVTAPTTSADIAGVDAIRVGERDRTDLGDLAELAESITAVGLLHPIVVTDNLDLVAGGRRLEAVKRLGWTEVPVTVVDITTVAAALRAEMDENTCRKSLDPVEASIARERRARLLAPHAAERRAHGKTAPGRSAAQPGRDLFGSDEAGNASANFAEASRPDNPVNVRRDAGVGTGFSHTSIDKVDEIRQIAERGSRTIGSGKTKREESVPEVVREIAIKQIPLLKTGAAIQPAHQAVRRALDEHLGKDPAVQQAEALKNFTSACVRLRDLTTFHTANVAAAIDAQHDRADRWDELERLHASIDTWFERINDARSKPGLRLAGGTR